MRDHTRLQAFKLAQDVAVAIYGATRNFPSEERYGLSAQMRRCALSVASNIVEGSARISIADYIRFLNIAYGSACELHFQVSFSRKLGFLMGKHAQSLQANCDELARVLNGLIQALRRRRPR